MTFDAWETGLCPPEDYLMHFRTKGSKNGVRKYQLADGTWTDLGLRERRKREGFGESRHERREAKKAERAKAREEKKAARQERKEAAKQAFKDRMGRSNELKELSDAELQAKINRVKMEQEYKELTKSPLLKAGEKFVENYIQNKKDKIQRAFEKKQTEEERKYEKEKEEADRNFELAKLQEQTKQKEMQTNADIARANADKSKAEADKADIDSGARAQRLSNESEGLKLQEKRFVADNTIMGGIKKAVNHIITGHGEKRRISLAGSGEAKRQRKIEKGFVDGILRSQKKVDRYNNPYLFGKTKKKHRGTLAADPDPWNRGKYPAYNLNGGGGKKKK